jgi:hypothetical protein
MKLVTPWCYGTLGQREYTSGSYLEVQMIHTTITASALKAHWILFGKFIDCSHSPAEIRLQKKGKVIIKIAAARLWICFYALRDAR